jgi:hypothetical protein
MMFCGAITIRGRQDKMVFVFAFWHELFLKKADKQVIKPAAL